VRHYAVACFMQRELGVRPGDRVGVLLANSAEAGGLLRTGTSPMSKLLLLLLLLFRLLLLLLRHLRCICASA